MNKKEFLQELRRSLRGYGGSDVEGVVRYYDEIISDNIDAGLSEYNAVAVLGNVRDIVACIKAELVETRMSENRHRFGNPIGGFVSLLHLCTSPLLLLLAIVWSIVYLSILLAIFATAIAIFAGGIGVLVMTAINAVYASGTVGIAGILMSVGAGAAAASVLCLMGIGFFKLSGLLLKGFTKMCARTVSNSKRRKINYEKNG